MIAELYRRFMPIEIRAKIGDCRRQKERRQVLEHIKSGRFSEHKEECAYMISHNQIYAMPYAWREEYNEDKVKVYYDQDKKMPYCQIVDRGGSKNLYFPAKWKKAYIQRYFNSLLCEQDPQSPHYYFDKDDKWFDKGTVFIDVGAAEGFIALQIVEKVGKIILLECDDLWLEPLRATFEKWEKKVRIVRKYAGADTGKDICRIDEFVDEVLDKTAIKIDVEGNERSVIEGGMKLLSLENVRAYICLYHNDKDEGTLVPIVKAMGYETETSDTYMFYRFAGETDYSFRHGVLRCGKVTSV